MLVVADATPLNILVRIEQIDLLPKLFRHILIPPKVHAELTHIHTPDEVRRWIAGNPAWLEIRVPKATSRPTATGEDEAIALAFQIGAGLFLADDRKARRDAAALGIPITGTLGVLERAARQGMIDLPPVVELLRRTDFHIAESELDALLTRWSGSAPHAVAGKS